MRAARSRRARRTLGAVRVRRAGLPRRGESRFLRPKPKESLVFKQRSGRRSPRATRTAGRSPVPMPRAGSFDCAPRIPAGKPGRAILPGLGGRAHPCARLGLACVAPRGGGEAVPARRAGGGRWRCGALGVSRGGSSWSAGSGGGASCGAGGAAWRRGAVAAWRGGCCGAAAFCFAAGVLAVAGLRRRRAGLGWRRRLGRGLSGGAGGLSGLLAFSATGRGIEARR